MKKATLGSVLVVCCLVLMLAASEVSSLRAAKGLSPTQRLAKYGWKQVGKADAKDSVKYTLSLYQRNLKEFEEKFLRISDPKSPEYQNYMSIDEILDFIAPPKEDSDYVINYLKERCDDLEIQNLRDALIVKSSVACVEKIFNVRMYKFVHTSGHSIIKTGLMTKTATIPEEIKSKVELLEGLSRIPIKRRSSVAQKEPKALDDYGSGSGSQADWEFNFVIPQTARRIYGIPWDASITQSKSSQSVVEFLPVGAPAISDMQQFASLANETFTNITHVDGPWDYGENDESTLDIEYLTAIAPNSVNWYITIGDGWQLEFAQQLFNMENAPWINSVSYGWPEQKSCEAAVTHARCQGIDSEIYVSRANTEFQKIGARGITVIVAAQDEGAPSEANEDCQLRNRPVWPIYPASSPWVTAVSGTTVIDTEPDNNNPSPPICTQYGYTCAQGTLQYPCMINNTYYTWTTGGGFSAFAPRPSYQDAAVSAYLQSNAVYPPTRFFNQSNRGYPDISALGDRILIILGGEVAITAGTSAATPIISGIFALVNDHLFAQGKAPLGFLNPLLYQMAAEAPETFTNIPYGNNDGTIGIECTYGYGATFGWDPVTGLGTPNFQQMLSYIDSLNKN